MRFVFNFVVLSCLLAGVGCFNRTSSVWPNFKPDTSAGPVGDPAAVKTVGLAGAQELPPKEAAAVNLKMAENLENDGKDADSLPYYERARQLDKTLSDRVSRRLAVVYDKLDEQALALKEFQELLKKYPKDSQLLADVAYSYYNRGQWKEAEHYGRQAVSADKTNKRGWIHLGMALGQLGKTNEAIEAFEKAVTPAEARSNLAFILAVRGQRDDAIVMYRKALELEPMLKVARAAVQKLESGASLTETPNLPTGQVAPVRALE